MTYDSDNTMTNHLGSPDEVPPLTNNHFLLPLPGARYAPRTLTFKGGKLELTHFLEVYDHVCAHFKITAKSEKCKGLIPYCTTKVAKMIARLPSYIVGDYDDLVSDLYYFLEEEDDSYDIGKVGAFTRKWRKRKVISINHFKRYHRKYLELVGKARGAHKMTDEDFNRYFWEGIHYTLRQKIEDRMTVSDPYLDVSVPFEMNVVVKAIEHLFNKKRFDQHIRGKASYGSSESDSDEDTHPARKHILSESEGGEEKDSEDTDHIKAPPIKRKTPPARPKPAVKKEQVTMKVEDEEISRLVHDMSKLNMNDPQYHARYQALYVDIILRKPSLEGVLSKPMTATFQSPNRPGDQIQRGPPTPRPYGPPQGPPPNPEEVFCFGCGKNGHQMRQCGELNAFLNQGTVTRNMGKLQWPDGSPIRKDRAESWIQAIGRVVKRANLVRAEIHHLSDDEGYQYVGITREEEDASSEEQEELEWSSGSIGDCYALGAERNLRVSKDARRQVQFNTPSGPQGMKKFPERKEAVGSGHQNPPIGQGFNHNSYQPGVPKRITPIDVHKNEFKGTKDHQFLPMEVDQGLVEKPGNKNGKISTNQGRSDALKVANPRPATGRNSLEIVQDIMKMPLTVTLEEAVHMSPTLRRDLTTASRLPREASSQALEKKEKGEKSALGSNVLQSLAVPNKKRLGNPRDELLKVTARVGDAKMLGVFDSGSQINVLSDKWMKICGLLVSTEGVERYRISGVNGGLARCVGVIPNAKIYVTGSKLKTIGELVVVEHAGFDLLLGRPWSTANKAGLREADEGTYLNFRSKGRLYEVNVAPNPQYPRYLHSGMAVDITDRDEMARLDATPECEAESAVYALAAGKVNNENEISDSEAKENIQESVPQEAQGDLEWAHGQSPEGARYGEDDDDDGRTYVRRDEIPRDDSEEEGGYRFFNPETPRQLKGKQPAKGSASMVIESELQDSYIRMVHKGANNKEWDMFCKAERKRLRQSRDQWNEWKEAQEATDVPQEDPSEDEDLVPDPPEPSATLATPEPEQTPLPRMKTKRRKEEPAQASVITTARRSQRTKRESQRARESEEWQKWRKRVYEREEKQTRKTVRHKNREASEAVVASLCASISVIEDGDEPQRKQGTHTERNGSEEADPIQNVDPWMIVRKYGFRADQKVQFDIDAVMGQPYDPRKARWEEISENADMGPVNPKELSSIGGLCETPEPGDLTIGDTSYATHKRAYQDPIRSRADPRSRRDWLIEEELDIIIEWLQSAPEMKGEKFLIHSISPEEIAVTLINTYHGKNHWEVQNRVKQRVLTLWRGSSGIITTEDQDTLECAQRAQERGTRQCRCVMSAASDVFRCWE
jgi:hypothetical protein